MSMNTVTPGKFRKGDDFAVLDVICTTLDEYGVVILKKRKEKLR